MRGQETQSAVRTVLVVLVDPTSDHDARFGQGLELLDVEQVNAHRAIEALDGSVMLRRTLLDERQRDTARRPSVAPSVAARRRTSTPVSLRLLVLPPALLESASESLGPTDAAMNSSVVSSDRLGFAEATEQRVEPHDHPRGADRAVYVGARTHAGVLVDDVEDPYGSPGCEAGLT